MHPMQSMQPCDSLDGLHAPIAPHKNSLNRPALLYFKWNRPFFPQKSYQKNPLYFILNETALLFPKNPTNQNTLSLIENYRPFFL